MLRRASRLAVPRRGIMKEGKFGEISMTPKKVDKKKQIAMKKKIS